LVNQAIKSFLESNKLPVDIGNVILDCHLSFDAIHIKQEFVYMKSTGKFIGLSGDLLDLRKDIGAIFLLHSLVCWFCFVVVVVLMCGVLITVVVFCMLSLFYVITD